MHNVLLDVSDEVNAYLFSESLKTAMETAMQQVRTDMFDMIEMGLPIGLSIAGTFMAIRCGWSFFRSFAH